MREPAREQAVCWQRTSEPLYLPGRAFVFLPGVSRFHCADRSF